VDGWSDRLDEDGEGTSGQISLSPPLAMPLWTSASSCTGGIAGSLDEPADELGEDGAVAPEKRLAGRHRFRGRRGAEEEVWAVSNGSEPLWSGFGSLRTEPGLAGENLEGATRSMMFLRTRERLVAEGVELLYSGIDKAPSALSEGGWPFGMACLEVF
jgi:hypothetical protein